jgi:hypothetical protein
MTGANTSYTLCKTCAPRAASACADTALDRRKDLTITIAPTGTGQVTATASDGHTRHTTTPLLDGARYWLEKGANPNTPIATVWSSAPPARACLTPRGGGTPFRCDRL